MNFSSVRLVPAIGATAAGVSGPPRGPGKTDAVDTVFMEFAGDDHGLSLPRTTEDLRAAGPEFLTNAFRAYGALRPGNRVARVTELVEVPGGSTGRKALLGIEYADPAPHLRTDLFVKFSRDLKDPVRDAGRTHMEQEVRLAELAAHPDFPIVVPATLFADYHRDSGTGILITERIRFGTNGIEPQHHEGLDHRMTDPLGHYRALVAALARLAGTERAGRFPPALVARFPTDPRTAAIGKEVPIEPEGLQRKLVDLADFVSSQPGLFRPFVRTEAFLAALPEVGTAIAAGEREVWRLLEADHDYLALCHWSANVDNAWFFTDRRGALQCGLLDWGRAGRMHVSMALWRTLSAAESTLWDRHLDQLLESFATEFVAAGGPALDVAHLRTRLLQYAAVTGVRWLLDVPALLRDRLVDSLTGLTRADPRIADDAELRAALQRLVNVLDLWQRFDFGAIFEDLS